MKLVAYHGNPQIKADILRTLEAHRAADEIVKGIYWENGKGCAVGCTINSSNHAEYEPRFGIPETLAWLEDVIFEGLPNSDAQNWPVEFMGAIEPGADLSRVGWQFLHWLLTDEQINPGINHPLVRDAVAQCAAVLERPMRGLAIDSSAAWSARSAALSVASSAESVAWSARSAGLSARSAALSVASSAESVAWSARSAAWSAGSAAWSAVRSAEGAESAAWSAWGRMAGKLLGLLAAAPVTTSP